MDFSNDFENFDEIDEMNEPSIEDLRKIEREMENEGKKNEPKGVQQKATFDKFVKPVPKVKRDKISDSLNAFDNIPKEKLQTERQILDEAEEECKTGGKPRAYLLKPKSARERIQFVDDVELIREFALEYKSKVPCDILRYRYHIPYNLTIKAVYDEACDYLNRRGQGLIITVTVDGENISAIKETDDDMRFVTNDEGFKFLKKEVNNEVQ